MTKGSIIAESSSVIAVESGGFTPASDSNLISWWDTTEGITDTGGLVDSWAVKAGSSSLALTQTLTARPTTGTRTINSINVLDCDGGDWMKTSSFPIPSSGNVTIMMMLSIDSIDDSFDSVFSMDATNDFQLGAQSATQFDAKVIVTGIGATSAQFTDAPFSGNNIFYIVFDFGNTEYISYVDGVAQHAATAYTTKLDASQSFMAFVNRSGGFAPDGAMGDIIITESVDSTTVDNHYDYLATKYAI